MKRERGGPITEALGFNNFDYKGNFENEACLETT